jgi:hypothetical protein
VRGGEEYLLIGCVPWSGKLADYGLSLHRSYRGIAATNSPSFSNSSSSSTLRRGSRLPGPGRCKQRPSTPHSQIQTDSRSKIEDEDEFEDEDDLVAATPR